jgi:tetratricopeptide (TPR) repeat protein
VVVHAFALWWLCLSAWAQTPEERFFEGSAAYRSGAYEQAEEVYRTLLDDGLTNGHVLYNLGNSLYRQEKLGAAMVAWRRAEVLLPRDPDVSANLERSRARTVERTGAVATVRPVFFWQRELSPREGTRLGATVVGLGFCLLLLGRWRRVELRIAGVSVVALGVVAALAGLDERCTLSATPPGIVLQTEVVAWSAVGRQGVELFALHEGAEVRVRERAGAEVQVELSDGRRGWLPLAAVGVIDPRAPFPVL